MKICKMCHEKKRDSEFNKNYYEELSDICKECEDECEMDEEEKEGWDDIIGHYD